MSRTYSTTTCFLCGKQHSTNGLAFINHMRMHVRQGELKEIVGVGDVIRFERTKKKEPIK